MRSRTVVRCALALGIAASLGACGGPKSYTGPGCLIYVYGLPDMKGYALPIREDSERLAEPWPHLAASAKVVYGTWRLYSEPEFAGAMGDYKAPADIVELAPDHHLGSLQCLEPAPETTPQYGWWW
ncbi:MAG TPA: beta/gamma crystallin-related protein [Stellaceae bacterium]|nr:beta/gamma crystallin-related protein [Stellaceae bacterium]